MQKVSKAYKESMKSSLRERAYIMISFGLVNQEAQAKATVDNGSYAYYSNKDNIFGEHIDDTVYATLEEEFTKVDGSMFFLPRATEGGRYYDTGIVSDKLVSEARCEVVISLNTIATDFKGLTINFGENYPVDFDIVGSTGQTIEFRGNTKSKWSTEEVLENTTYSRANNDEVSKKAQVDAILSQKLDSISDDTKEIRKEITDVKVKVNDLSERVVMVEQSTKSAHHRLDRYEEEEIYHGKPRKRWWV